MTDDTVDRARQDVLDIVAAYGIQNSEKGPFAQYLDALIAAVRAENAPTPPTGSFGYCAVCYHPLDQCSHCDQPRS